MTIVNNIQTEKIKTTDATIVKLGKRNTSTPGSLFQISHIEEH